MLTVAFFAASAMACPLRATNSLTIVGRSTAGALRPRDSAIGVRISRTRATMAGRFSANEIAAWMRVTPAASRTAKATTIVVTYVTATASPRDLNGMCRASQSTNGSST